MPKKSTVLNSAYKKDQARTRMGKKKFLANYFSKTGNISELCKLVGINRTTFYNWVKDDKEFRQGVEDQEEGLIDFVESKAFQLINSKNPTMIIFFLKTRGKKRGYIETSELDINAKVKSDSVLEVKVVQIKDEKEG